MTFLPASPSLALTFLPHPGHEKAIEGEAASGLEGLSCRVGEGVDVGHPPVVDGDRDDRRHPPVPQRHHAGPGTDGQREEGGRRGRPEELQQPGGHGVAAGHDPDADPSANLGLAGDAGVEQGQEGLEIAAGAGGDEPLGDLALLGRFDDEAAAGVVGPHGAPGPAGELAAGGRRAPDDLADRLERVLEHVVEDEDGALGRRQPFQDEVQGQADAVVERDPVGGVDGAVRRPVADRRLGLGRVAAIGPQPVETEPADDDHQPSAHVVDPVDVGPHEAGEGLLDDVFGLAEVAEHPEGDVEHVTAVAFACRT